jgi:cobalt-zinc-cadmium efflux system membrane fusion protein
MKCARMAAWLVVGGLAAMGIPRVHAAPVQDSLDLTDEQARNFTTGRIGLRAFPQQETAVGGIDFDEDLQSQVYPPYQGKLLQLFARTGDTVRRGQMLFTVDSPDLVQAESTLIAADGVLTLTTRALARAADLYHAHGMSQKDYDQAVSDQQTAAGNLHAARDALRLLGKTEVDIDHIAASRRVDPALVVRSPVNGVVVSRNGAPGTYVQPGTAPAPFTVADNSVMWMLANVPESLSTQFRIGQPVAVHVGALPDHVFLGRLSTVGASIDPGTRRFVLRAEIADPDHLLRSGMFADFTITTGEPVMSLALPLDGVVREGDGTETAWVTSDGRHFARRTITIGRAWQGYRQILGGLREGEQVVTDGAVFLSNMLTADPSD